MSVVSQKRTLKELTQRREGAKKSLLMCYCAVGAAT
jgi:hypothetical protein